jgi:predicted Fe-Mo cluster-binding NifX family protein
MKVAITTKGANLGCMIDTRFGRAEHILIVDTQSGVCDVHDNSSTTDASSGAGVRTGKAVADLGAEAVITGHVGPKAFQVLHAAGVDVYTVAAGTAQDALRAFEAGQLEAVAQPNVQGHWS